MSDFINLTNEQKTRIFTQAGVRANLPAFAVEKDWWVTEMLRIVFSLPYAEAFVFKGGTSLSKGYDLINRFSEDIDLAIDRAYFNMEGDLSRSQIKKLRKKSAKFISTELLTDITEAIEKSKLSISSIGIEPFEDSDTDPLQIYITYEPLTKKSEYIEPRVLLEISCRSLREPCEDVPIQSIVDREFESADFANPTFNVRTVEPQRTFLEKIFLLHEEWQKQNIRIDRLSRHLYDLEKLMDTDHADKALENGKLFYHIAEHRSAFSPLRGIDYNNHKPSLIQIVPPDKVIADYENDYDVMRENMFVGESKTWDAMLKRLTQLQKRIRGLDW
ncbi:nucleotidyl transferase AbiEii/AbiGii toxin family protein [Luteirhabdus pelagi]|uniref:nucleotidyl transferase AbiEii/AbiGii toxin family protein n=1 Tax=Luteirhabdus pelagi TaxID=2792783 RepID=UPI001939DFEC|nr:nucleotidyl transferase AbiEii/AbiGii toxin family protein [Luteirhabdus pelagi]